MTIAYLGLGSNIGDPPKNVEEAIMQVGKIAKVLTKSSLYSAKPWGVVDQPDFCNAAIKIETDLSPYDLLSALKKIEDDMGRVEARRWGPRLIDLDILTYDNLKLDGARLTIPHPRMFERGFVLIPLAEIDSQYVSARDALPESELSGVTLMNSATTKAQ